MTFTLTQKQRAGYAGQLWKAELGRRGTLCLGNGGGGKQASLTPSQLQQGLLRKVSLLCSWGGLDCGSKLIEQKGWRSPSPLLTDMTQLPLATPLQHPSLPPCSYLPGGSSCP